MLITKIKQNIPLLILFLITLFIVVTNYTPGTWLTGWDNLHPEFDFKMNIYRSLNAVWQEYQGLGLLGGMGHAADLPRQLFLWVVLILIPTSMLRYFFHFLMLFVGVTGTYFFVRNILLNNVERNVSAKIAFVGGIFYLLNLGTVQNFFTPFEPFSTFWGSFPWEMYTLFSYLKNPNRKNLISLFVINLLAVPQAYVQTIFLVYFLIVIIILGIHLLQKFSKDRLKQAITVCALILAINAFWLLPNIYFVLTNVHVTQNSMNNFMNTQRFYELNKRRGNIVDFALMKGFSYDTLGGDPSQSQTFLMQAWRNHIDSFQISLIGFGLFAIIMLGIFRKSYFRFYFIALLGLVSLALLSDIPIISTFNQLSRVIPLVSQIFRNASSKFIVPEAFIFSLGLSSGISYIVSKTNKKNVVIFLISVLILIYGFPAFTGNFFSKLVKVPIPKQYFALFNYLQTQDKNARIMNLPQDSYWGWGSYKWGATGSGFLWYGVEQPIMDRAFDVWSQELEQYYWELIYALKKKDQKLFNSVLYKYQISYVVIDSNYVPSDSSKNKNLIKQVDMLEGNKKVKKIASFGFISVYETGIKSQNNSYVDIKSSIPKAIKQEQFSNKDVTIQNDGTYISQVKNGDIFYPFGSLFSNRTSEEEKFHIEETKKSFIFSNLLTKGDYTLDIPNFLDLEDNIPLEISQSQISQTMRFSFKPNVPKLTIDKKPVTIEPDSKKIEVPLSSQYLISINNQDFINSQDLQNNQGIFISKNNPTNSISIFGASRGSSESILTNKFINANPCIQTKEKGKVAKLSRNDELIIESQALPACISYGDILKYTPGNVLFEVSFLYKSTKDEYPKFCLYSEIQKKCINNKDKDLKSFSNSYKEYKEYFESHIDPKDTLSFALILEPGMNDEKNTLQQIRYKNIVIIQYPQLTSEIVYFPSEQIKSNPSKFYLEKDTELKVEISKNHNSSTIEKIIANNLYKKNLDIYNDLFHGDSSFAEKEENGQKFVRLISKNNSFNFKIELSDALLSCGYLLSLKTRNVMDFPLTLKMNTIQNNETYINTLIPAHKIWENNYYVLAPQYRFDKGLRIYLNSNSFNRTQSVNDIAEISLYPIPYEFLTNLSLKRTNASKPMEEKIIFEVRKKNIWSYEIKFNQPVTSEETLILYQSFNKGWKAWLNGKELKEHVLINNWANGWRLPQDYGDPEGASNIVIIFWPQYLQFIGFILLIGSFIWLLARKNV